MSQLNEELLLMGLPIYINKVGKIYQPTINKIITIGEKNYFNLISPLIINENYLVDEYKDMDFYDVLFLKNNYIFLQQTMVALSLFFKQDISIGANSTNLIFKIGNDGIINKNNFPIVQNVIKKIHCIKEPEIEKLPKNMTDEQKRIHEKMQYHRNRVAKRESPTLKDIINIVMHGGSSFIPYKTIGEFTYYQLINSYHVILSMNSYNEYLQYKTSMKFEVEEDLPHWTKIIKTI